MQGAKRSNARGIASNRNAAARPYRVASTALISVIQWTSVAGMPLQRHQLAWPGAAGWQRLLKGACDGQAEQALAHWAASDLPLVVAQQRVAGMLSLGLPAPHCFGSERLALQMPHGEVRAFGAFPLVQSIAPLLADIQRPPWLALCSSLQRLHCAARVYGSHGWQALTGLDHLRAGSDLDLLLPVADAPAADAVCHALVSAAGPLPRLDGELLFACGAAVAWREWLQWRTAALPRGLLVKRLRGVALESGCGLTAAAMP